MIITLSILILTAGFIMQEFGYLDNFYLRIADKEQALTGNGRTERWVYHFNQLNLEYLFFGNSHTGHQGMGSTMSHNNYLALIYRGGFLTFLSFIYILIKLLKSKVNNVKVPYRTFAYIILIASISQELINSYGPNFVIWPIVATLAFYNNNQ